MIKVALELADLIRKENMEGRDRIPSSDKYLRIWTSHIVRPEEEIRKILNTLRDCHYIFIINLVAPDPNFFVYGEEAYIYAEPTILADLKHVAEENLEKLYESSNYKKKSASQITKELFSKIKEYNNTPLGRAINVVVMMEQYNRILTNTSSEYTDQYRRDKIQEVYNEDVSTVEELATFNSPVIDSKRAVDILNEGSKEKSDPSWTKATKNFNVEFLVRVHFRKYEFDVIKKLIQKGKIKDENELRFIRDTLMLIETREKEDRLLVRYKEEIIELRRYCQAKLNMIRQGILPKGN